MIENTTHPIVQPLNLGPPHLWVARFGLPVGGGLLDSGDPTSPTSTTPPQKTSDALSPNSSITEDLDPQYATLALQPIQVFTEPLSSSILTSKKSDILKRFQAFVDAPFVNQRGEEILSETWRAIGGIHPLILCSISYEVCSLIEDISISHTSSHLPLIWAARYHAVYVWSHLERLGWIYAVDELSAQELEERLQSPFTKTSNQEDLLFTSTHKEVSTPTLSGALRSPHSPHRLKNKSLRTQIHQREGLVESVLKPLCSFESYSQSILEIKRLIYEGEVYQVNFTIPLKAQLKLKISPHHLYTRLRNINPSSFGVFLRISESISILSLSPERLIRWSYGGEICTSPIKGTRPRDQNDSLDQALKEELLTSEKDRAEHLMIVDLERNDLGRVCLPKTVKVTELSQLKTFPTVHHLVSTISGQLRPEVDLIQLLQAIFPGGSITGAPKVRAMEIIQRLEMAPRGIYCGALGYLDPAGGGDLNIPIRTAWLQGQQLTYHAGGGIVADSDPQEEWRELWVKTNALLQGLGIS